MHSVYNMPKAKKKRRETQKTTPLPYSLDKQ